MKVFVAGAAGVIGRRLVPMLVADGHEVTGMTRRAERAAELEKLGASRRSATCSTPRRSSARSPKRRPRS